MNETFAQFKQKFYGRVPDMEIFDCEDYNLLKVVLDGLKVNYAKRGIKNQSIFQTSFRAKLSRFARRLKYLREIRTAKKICNTLKQEDLKKRFFFFDNGRVSKTSNGQTVSFYFHKIEQHLGKENCCTIYQTQTELKNGFTVQNLLLSTLFKEYSSEDKKTINNLIAVYHRLEALSLFSADELLNIRIAFNKFFDEYRFWNFLFEDNDIQAAMFDEHYHREGFILALKRNKIRVIEIQHGLIAREDLFYVFPQVVAPVAKKALFPDKIFTYGRYWSNILRDGYEFESEQIDELGVYQEINTFVSSGEEKSLNDFLNGSPFLLVTTQTFLHDYFIEYITWLSMDLNKHGNEVKLVVKIHPSEKETNYSSIKRLNNVRLFAMNTEYLLSRCRWHLSCYSTTLYDATKYECENFSLFIDKCSDYTEGFIKQGISKLIYNVQNPILEKSYKGESMTVEVSTLYESFEKNKHKLNEI